MQQIYKGFLSISTKKEGYVRLPEDTTPQELHGLTVFVPHDDLGTGLHGDTVMVELSGRKERDLIYGKVVGIASRGKKAYAGVLEQDGNSFYLIPQDKRMYADIMITDADLNGAIPGSKVVVAITKWSDAKKSPWGEVVAVLGRPGENNAEMLAYALERGFSNEHTAKVQEEAEAIKAKGISEEDKRDRRDFRDILTFTIDPWDAKDFDDAISYKELGRERYEVGIHIADVSHYVRQGTALDDEAVGRQTSVYLVDRCIPMLPEVLSNDLCSLVQGEDRLVMSAVFELDAQGNVFSEWYGKSVIRSAKRFTYEEAQASLDDPSGLYHKELSTLNVIAKVLLDKRFQSGALSLDTEEVKFKLDDSGVPVDVLVKERGDSHKMIEELMLLANRKVSEFITRKAETAVGKDSVICVYRVHDKPDPDRMHDLDLFIRSLGYKVRFMDGLIPSQDLNQLLIKLSGRPEKDLLQRHVTRAMAKATYSTKNIGHYGLAFDYYSHFTSPIRRYPDVLTHRILSRVLQNDFPKPEERSYFDQMCQSAGQREKDASDAERGSIKYKQVEYMGMRLGQTFDGVVSGVSQSGVFVEEKKSKSEGLVRMRDLGDDFYVYDEKGGRVFGERTGVEWKIGTPVRIRVKETNLDIRAIDYQIVG